MLVDRSTGRYWRQADLSLLMSDIVPLPKGCYVILHIGSGPSRTQEADYSDMIVRNGGRFYLQDNIWIERLEEAAAKNIQRACEPAHYKIDKDIWDRHLYAFVMEMPDRQQKRFEGLDILQSAVCLSRFVNPTSVCDRYCAQVMHFGYADSAVYAIEFRGTSLDVTLGPSGRDWLTEADGETLRRLMSWTSKDKPMLARVHRAYWNHEYAMRSYHLDVKWMFTVEGLDALINTGSNNEHHFVTRIKKIADCLSISISQDQLRSAYKIRNKLVHTERFLYGLDEILPRIEHDPLYEKIERILRDTVRTALLDDNFGLCFLDDTSVARWW